MYKYLYKYIYIYIYIYVHIWEAKIINTNKIAIQNSIKLMLTNLLYVLLE
jgi:hypothetical protein